MGGEGLSAGAELVRLSPPQAVVAPTIYVERSVVDLFQDGKGLIDQLTELPEPVRFSGRIATLGAPSPVPSTVTLVATSLASTSVGTVAAFSRTMETLEDGTFELDLLPGTYRLSAEPLDGELARTEAELTVSDLAETQIGKTIEVAPRLFLSGTGRYAVFPCRRGPPSLEVAVRSCSWLRADTATLPWLVMIPLRRTADFPSSPNADDLMWWPVRRQQPDTLGRFVWASTLKPQM
jgi:hypothetical protein